jgi:transposase
LKVADGASTRAVAARGLLRPRRSETVARWVHRYVAGGPAAFAVRPGRGRKPAFSPSAGRDRP